MGKLYFGLVLTLLVSLLVMLAGGVFARRVLVEVTEVDRDVFRGFVKGLEDVIEGEKQKEEDRLLELAKRVGNWRAKIGLDLPEELAEVPGIRGAFLFQEDRLIKEWIMMGGVGSRSAAEVVVEGGKVPLIHERAVVVTKSFLKEVMFGTIGRIENEEKSFHGWWYSPYRGELVVLLVENDLAMKAFLDGVQNEAAGIYEVTQRMQEKFVVEVDGEVLIGNDSYSEKRSASRESSLGEFSVKAWNRREEKNFFDWPTMASGVGLGFLIATVGVIVFLSQKKMWRESEERVSFVNRVSHELGTPLTNMNLNLELASRSLRSQPELAGRRLEKVREEVSRLSRLVINVLTHSRKIGEELPDHRVHCDPDVVVEGVAEQFRPALERRGVELELNLGGVGAMEVDADGLAQIVWNLISNVEKYAASGKWMGVETQLNEGNLEVEVRDRGVGISKEKRAEIFEAFERVHDSTKEGVSGTGLGLSISRDLAEAMGGKLLLLDDEKTTVFQLTIPKEIR